MDLKNDFVNEDVVELIVHDKIFKFKPTTGGDELEWLNEYIIVVDGVSKQDFTALNKCKLRNIIDVPYSKELINQVIGINKSWSEMNIDERLMLLKKLNPKLLNDIIVAINNIDSPDQKKTC
jgi:hypothetical protein